MARLLPGALGDARSSVEESFSDGLLEAPAYTKPNVFRGMEVPAVFLSGNHKAIAEWRLEHALERTKANRPDLYEAWVAEHADYFRRKRPRVRQTQYRPRAAEQEPSEAAPAAAPGAESGAAAAPSPDKVSLHAPAAGAAASGEGSC